MSICVVLWSPRTLFVKSTLHERPLYWTLYCGDCVKIACLWIKGKITASISSSFCILEIQSDCGAGWFRSEQICSARHQLSLYICISRSSTPASSALLLCMKGTFKEIWSLLIPIYKCVHNTFNTSLYIISYITSTYRTIFLLSTNFDLYDLVISIDAVSNFTCFFFIYILL